MEKADSDPETFDSMALYRRFRDVREEMVDENRFLIDQAEFAIHMLEPMAIAVWELLADPVRVDDVATTFYEFFPGTDRERIRDDIEDLFAQFESYNLIQAVPAQKQPPR